jgi:hypothetical protein
MKYLLSQIVTNGALLYVRNSMLYAHNSILYARRALLYEMWDDELENLCKKTLVCIVFFRNFAVK